MIVYKPMERAAFFDNLGKQFLSLRRPSDPAAATIDTEGAMLLATGRTRTRLENLVRQMVAGAGISMSGEKTSLSAGLEAIRDYSVAHGLRHTASFEITSNGARAGGYNNPLPVDGVLIEDLCTAAADYCEHLRTEALELRAAKKPAADRRGHAGSQRALRRKRHPARQKLGSDRHNAPQSLRARRREIVRISLAKRHCLMGRLARDAGISDTALRAMIRGDQLRYSIAARNRLLKILTISLDDWGRDHRDR
jgi:hypothetical protein